MESVTTLGLNPDDHPKGEIRLRASGVVLSGRSPSAWEAPGYSGLAGGAFSVAQKQPDQVFALLSHWGYLWLLGMAAMVLLWDLAKVGSALSGVAGRQRAGIGRGYEPYGRPRRSRYSERMITETCDFVCQRAEAPLTHEMREGREEQQ